MARLESSIEEWSSRVFKSLVSISSFLSVMCLLMRELEFKIYSKFSCETDVDSYSDKFFSYFIASIFYDNP